MYLVHLKAALVEAIKHQFDQDYPESDFRGIHTSIEYPVEPQAYPGIWVDFEDTAPLRIAGVKHREFTEPGPRGQRRRYTRWRFTGTASFTVVALTSLERDRLYDELVRVMAFGQGADVVNEFRNYIENNDLIAMNFDFDTIEARGNAAAPGTPWGTDEIIYERTINMNVIGEFTSDGAKQALVPLSAIKIYERAEGEPDTHPDTLNAAGATAWQ